MKKHRIIGIVGGVGPYAGTDLANKVFASTRASADQEHLPVVLISLPHLIADRTQYVLGRTRANPAGAIFRVVRLLERAGATVIGIPCNTAHAPAIFDVLRAKLRRAGSRAKLLHLIEEVADYLGACSAKMGTGLVPCLHAAGACPPWRAERPASDRQRQKHSSLRVRRVGLLATTGTCRSGVYEQVLSKAGIEVILPKRATRERLLEPAIYDRRFGIKACAGPVSARARAAVRKAMDELLAAGAEAIILGCTELPLAYGRADYRGRPVIDSTLVLARALVREAGREKLRD